MSPQQDATPTQAWITMVGLVVLTTVIALLSLTVLHTIRAALVPLAVPQPSPVSFEQYLPRYPVEREWRAPSPFEDPLTPPMLPHEVPEQLRLDAVAPPVLQDGIRPSDRQASTRG